MHHEISLITNISVALVAAFAGGFIARRLGLPTIVGYLLAGMAIGPFTPGFVGDVMGTAFGSAALFGVSLALGAFLAGALLSIMVNPLMFRAIPLAERALQGVPWLWERLDRHPPQPVGPLLPDAGHVVVVGYGRVGEHIVTVLERLGIPRLVVERDSGRADEFTARGVPTLYGDAANSEVLTHAGLAGARALVVTLPDEAATEVVVAAARDLAPELPVIARAATTSGVGRLSSLGAQDVIHPELEGGLEVVRHTLLSLGYPATQVQTYTDAVRRDQYDTSVSSPAEHQVLEQLLHTARGMEIAWRTVPPDSPLAGRSLAEANLRARTGASVIALIRDQQMLANPKSSTVFAPGDLVGLIGEGEDVAAAERLIADEPGPHGAAVGGQLLGAGAQPGEAGAAL